MNYRARKQKLVAEINITPFTDVILVLLIIFMIATPLLSQSGLKVKLPEAKTALPVKAKEQVNITVTDEGMIYLENEIVTKKELKEKIYKLHNDNPAIGVVLLSDRLVQFKNIVGILDTLSELGIKNLNIAATTN